MSVFGYLSHAGYLVKEKEPSWQIYLDGGMIIYGVQ